MTIYNTYPKRQLSDYKNSLIEQLLSSCRNKTYKKILAYIYKARTYNYSDAQSYIALRLGISIRQLQRYLYEMRDLGWFSWDVRFKKINRYILGDIFQNKEVRATFDYLYGVIFEGRYALSNIFSRSSLSKNVIQEDLNYIYTCLCKTMGVNTVNENDPFGDGTRITTALLKEQERKRDLSKVNDPQRMKMIELIQKKLPLTPFGVNKLRCYPASALQQVYSKLESAHKANLPDRYILGICENHCKENNLKVEREWFNKQNTSSHSRVIDWERYEELKKEQKTSVSGAPCYYTIFKPSTEPPRYCSQEELAQKRSLIDNPLALRFLDIILNPGDFKFI